MGVDPLFLNLGFAVLVKAAELLGYFLILWGVAWVAWYGIKNSNKFQKAKRRQRFSLIRGGAYRAALLVSGVVLLSVAASNGPRLVLEPNERATTQRIDEQMNRDLPPLVTVEPRTAGDSERLEQMRELDRQTDARTVDR